MSEKLPLEILKEKYIPITEFSEKYDISVEEATSIVKENKIRYAEFKAPGATRRSMHVNPEDVLPYIKGEISNL